MNTFQSLSGYYVPTAFLERFNLDTILGELKSTFPELEIREKNTDELTVQEYKDLKTLRESINFLDSLGSKSKMLDYQVQAFCLYATLQVIKNDQNDLLLSQVADFESKLMKQLETNKDHIDEILIYQSQNYIALQLEKSKTKQLAFNNFKK